MVQHHMYLLELYTESHQGITESMFMTSDNSQVIFVVFDVKWYLNALQLVSLK